MSGVGASLTSWLAGAASIGTVIQGLRSIVAEMEKATQLRKGMQEVALTTEQLSMKIAHLRKDVSVGGVAAVTKDIADIAKQTAASMQAVGNILFFSESVMKPGGPAAKSAATVIAQFGAPAGLTPEETALMPAIFKITKADTNKKQMQIVNQLRAATAASIAETGEFIQPFIEPLTMGMQRGFTFSEVLAQMTSGILTSGGVEKGGTATRAAIEIATGKTKKALDFYYKEGKRRGVDYGEMSGAERYKFVSELYQEFEAAGPKKLDIFKTTVGGKGAKYLGAMFGEIGQAKYAEVLPEIEAARESDAVQQMAKQYLTLMTAERMGQDRRRQMGEAGIGRKRRPEIVLEEMTTQILKQSKALTGGFGEVLGFAVTPKGIERHKTAAMLIRANLRLGLDTARGGSAWRAELLDLQKELPLIESFRLNPEFVQRTYRATEGFTLPERLGRRTDAPAATAYQRGFREYFGLSEEATGDQVKAVEEHTKALKEHAVALKEQTHVMSTALVNLNYEMLD